MVSLSSLLMLPFLTAVAILVIPGNYRFVIRGVAILGTGLTALFATLLFAHFIPGVPGFQFVQEARWIPAIGLNYHVGVDGLNVGLMLLAAIVGFAATLVSQHIHKEVKLYYILLLLMIGGALGAFLSLDLFFFYFFNEMALVPTFLMMGMWGRGENKTFATYQIALYLTLGALLALAGLAMLYSQSGAGTLNIVDLKNHLASNPLKVSSQKWIFGLMLFGFGTLVGLWPFHSWAAPGYGAAPTATAMMHAGVLKKAGVYALIRVALPLMPEGSTPWLPVLAWLCLGNLLYCGWVAMRQRDLALVLGNSSLAHMGFCFLGIASLSVVGVTGAVLVMVAHGFLAALSFALLGHLVSSTGTADLGKLGGLLQKMPFFGAALIMCFMAGCGLPGFASFPGELSVLFGAWKSNSLPLHGFVIAGAWAGLIIGGVYMLRALRSILFGPLPSGITGGDIASFWRQLPFAILIGAMLLFGFAPNILSERIRPTVAEIVKLATTHSAPAPTPTTVPVAAVQH